MPRGRPGDLRAQHHGPRIWEDTPPSRIHGLSARTSLAIHGVERLLWPPWTPSRPRSSPGTARRSCRSTERARRTARKPFSGPSPTGITRIGIWRGGRRGVLRRQGGAQGQGAVRVEGESAEDGAEVVRWDYESRPHQEWRLRLVQKDRRHFTLENRHSGKVLSVYGEATGR
ncbi:RICIN domain-containing protein [Streptomyces sp. NPDC002825]|uniref:RICIN domain-containing protein n=1 Tax=Streptomyces sp. NPDC002825 TaxID=3154666 RepID=UPI0033167493